MQLCHRNPPSEKPWLPSALEEARPQCRHTRLSSSTERIHFEKTAPINMHLITLMVKVYNEFVRL